MKKIVALVLCLSLLAIFSSAAMAQKQNVDDVDFGALTCQDFIMGLAKSDEETAGLVLLWLDGYLSGVSGDTVIRWQTIDDFSNNIVDACGNQPDRNLLEVAKEIGISE
ncbi:HdeA family protein [Desulfarculus baarsii]